MTADRSESRDELQTLRRGLCALRFLNSNGPTTLTALSQALGLTRATTHRIMMTLLTEGYCRRVPNSHLYLVSPSVAELSSGMQSANLLTNVAMDLIGRLGQELKLPVALVVPGGVNMRVLLASEGSGAKTKVRISPGYETPMLRATTGLLYLALEREQVREKMLAQLFTENCTPQSQRKVRQQIDQARLQTFMIIDDQYPEGSLGVAVINDELPVGGVMLRYDKYAISRQTVVAELLPRLRTLATGISHGLKEHTAHLHAVMPRAEAGAAAVALEQ